MAYSRLRGSEGIQRIVALPGTPGGTANRCYIEGKMNRADEVIRISRPAWPQVSAATRQYLSCQGREADRDALWGKLPQSWPAFCRPLQQTMALPASDCFGNG